MPSHTAWVAEASPISPKSLTKAISYAAGSILAGIVIADAGVAEADVVEAVVAAVVVGAGVAEAVVVAMVVEDADVVEAVVVATVVADVVVVGAIDEVTADIVVAVSTFVAIVDVAAAPPCAVCAGPATSQAGHSDSAETSANINNARIRAPPCLLTR